MSELKVYFLNSFLKVLICENYFSHLFSSFFGHLSLVINITFVPKNHPFHIC